MAATKRTQMYFPLSLFRDLQAIAQQEHASVAELVRRAAQKYLEDYQGKINWKNDSLWNIIGSGESRIGDLSAEHDHYLYGVSKKRPSQ